MDELNASGNRSTKEIEKLRHRVTNLEQVHRKIAESTSLDEELDKAWIEWERTFDATKDSIMVIDGESKIIQANIATSRLLGKPLENIIGKTCWQVVHETEKPPEECLLRKVQSTEYHKENELYVPEKDIWLQVSVEPIPDNQDGNNKIVHIMRDITKYKKVEQLVKKERDKAQKYLDIASVILVAIDSEQRVGLINKKGCEILGYSEDEITGKNWFDNFLPERIRDEVRVVFKKLIEGHADESEYYENPILTKNGQEQLIAWHNTVLKDEKGNILAILCSGEDVTEERKARYELRDSDEKFKVIFEGANDGIVYIDSSGLILNANERALQLLGGRRTELLNKHVTELGIFAKEIIPSVISSFEEVLTGRQVIFTVPIRNKQGREIILECSASLTRTNNDRGDILVITRDITDNKKSQEAYHSLVDHSLQGLAIFQDGRVVFANQAMAKITGYSVKEMLASPSEKVQAFVHPDDRELVWNRHKVRLNGEEIPEQYEIRGIRKDGSICWLEIHASLIEYQGKPAIQAAYVDITEIKKAEQQEQEYIRQLQYLSESATEFVKLTPDQDIYMLIAEKLKELCDGSIVAVNTWDEASERLCVRALLGLGKYTLAITQIMGVNPLGQCFPLDSDAREGLGQGKLLKVPNGIYDLSPGIPKIVCQAIEKLLGLGDVYAMGLNSEGQLYGSVTILTRSKTGLKNHELIETFMNQAAVAIHQWQAMVALRDSERKYRSLFENARDVIATFDTKGNITDVNRAVEDYGFKREQLIGKSLFNYTVKEYKAKAIEDFEMLISGRPVSGEMDVITPKGIFTVYYSDNPIMLDKEVVGIQAILKNITERKRSEEELKKTEAWLRTILTNAPITIFATDKQGLFTLSEGKALKNAGLKPSDIVGISALEFYGEMTFVESTGAVVTWEDLFCRALAGETINVQNELQGVCFDNQIGPLQDTNGKIIGIVGIALDITERKKAEDKLHEYQNKLKAMVSERLMVEERERKRIAIGLHDHICQKLVMTKLTLESSLQLVSGSNVLGSLKVACGAIGDMIEEIDSLTFELSNPLLHELGLVMALKKYLSEEMQKKHGIAFELEGDEQLSIPHEEIKNSLYRISRELLTNVIKHAQASNVKISVHKSLSQIRIVIQDNGMGFDITKVRSEVFKTSRFGLFSIREQLEYMGGSLEIESEPGRGTTATVVIPLACKGTG